MVRRRRENPATRASGGQPELVTIRPTADKIEFVFRSNSTTTVSDTLPRTRGESDASFALRAVETLRAKLVKYGLAPQSSSLSRARSVSAGGNVPAPAPAAGPSTPSHANLSQPTTWLEAGAAYSWSPDISGSTGILLGARHRLSPHIGIGAFGLFPLTAASILETEGSADVRTWLLGGALDATWPIGAWRLSFGGGGAVAILEMSGNANPPLVSLHDTVVSLAPFARFSLSAPVSERIDVSAELWAMTSAPATIVRFGERDVARWGDPQLMTLLTLRGALF